MRKNFCLASDKKIVFTFDYMKKNILTLWLFAGSYAQAQTITEYYDYQWKSCVVGLARFTTLLTHTDSGWYREDYFIATSRLQMKGFYKDSACNIKNGSFAYYHPNGYPQKNGRYINNKEDGLWLSFHYNGMMSDSTVYILGQLTGTALGWHENGNQSYSSVYEEDGSAVSITWFDNGQPMQAGKLQNNKKQGRWQYFQKNGTIAAKEDYEQDRLVNRIYYDEAGKPITDTTSKDREAVFNGGPEKWKKFLLKNIEFPYNYKLVNTNLVTVQIAALIDEEGNVKDAYVQVPFDPVFDKEALRVFKKCPPWIPAISHNRKVKMYIRQPISFAQDE